MSSFLSGRNFGSNIQTSDIADDAITLAKLANGTANQNIQYNASGVPVDVALPASGKVLQVVTMVKTDHASITSSNSATYQDLPGLTQAITPSASSSKILILGSVTLGNQIGTIHARLVRGSTAIGVHDAVTSSHRSTFGSRIAATPYSLHAEPLSFIFEDSPNTTSATTYKLQAMLGTSYSGTITVNAATGGTGGADYFVKAISTLTLMELSG